MIITRRYGVQTTIIFPMIKRGVVDLAATGDWTPATGDTKISKDEGAVANTTNNPAIASGIGWKLVLTATEMQAARISVQIVDSATKAVEDQYIIVETFGNLSAQVPDLSWIQDSGTAQAGGGSTVTLASTASATDNLYKLSLVALVGGTGAGQCRVIASYVGSTKVATVNRAWATNPDSTSQYVVIADETAPLDTNTRTKADVEMWLGVAMNALIGGKVDGVTSIRSATAQAGAAGTITLDASASATDNYYRGAVVFVISGTGAGQARHCTGYVGSTKVASVSPNWITNPDNTSVFVVIPAKALSLYVGNS